MRPVVGLTCCFSPGVNYYHVAQDYVLSVQAAGGGPVILPHTAVNDAEHILNCIDGLLLTGGGDVDPYHFGQEPWPESGSIDPDRDVFELAIAAVALARGIPVLGICRGMQIINLAAGGTICQDIKRDVNSSYKHMQEAPRWYPTHGIKIKRDTILFNTLSAKNFRVNSFHHQMVDQIAPGFIVTATAGDGVVEAIESTDPSVFAVGVQFHPENMWKRKPQVLQLFEAHIKASARFLSKKPGHKK